MKVFDVHTHVFPDAIASRAIEVLRERSHGLPVYSDGTAAGLEVNALRAGYTAWMNCPVVTNLHQMHSVNTWCIERNHWPHLSLGGLYPQGPTDELLAEIDRIAKAGLYGIKLHPEYQQFSPLDPSLDPIWQSLIDHNLPVLFHAGLDIAYIRGEQCNHPRDFAELARRWPKLVIICAHLGGWLNWQEVESQLVGAPVYLDTAFVKQWMADQSQFERIIRKHGVDHVLFGTDSPWNDLSRGIREITELNLSDAEKQQILYGNAAKLFHLPQ
jgi:uncharacterized protein